MMLCLCVGCAKQEPPKDEGDNDTQEEEQQPDVDVIDTENTIINPLTGEAVEEDISSLRPYCIMINNHSHGRPSIGLSHASIIYEVLVEGDITRLMAIFNNIDGLDIGNIRSCRHYYISLNDAYDGIYIHWGSSNIGRDHLAKYGTDDLDALSHGNGFYREDFRSQNEHNAMIHGTKAVAYAKEHYETEHSADYDTSYGLAFSESAAEQCTNESTDFTVQYLASTKTEFKYDPEKKCYNAYMGGTEYKDRGEYYDNTDDASIDLANVIILGVPYTVVDSYAHKDMELTGSGTGYFATGGKYVEIKWSRADRDDNFHYTLTDGTPLALSVGKTYVCIAPLGTGGSVTW